ncbi:MAG: site-2 protease family protein [Deltaproteobacteria bacterium]|nr:MAG: site-2 protease family protein [Deltaproteobacteria bacterium]
MMVSWPVPFILNPGNLAVDAVVSFIVAVLLTVTITAEAQAYAATFLGDARVGAKDRFHFIAFLHLDLWGTLCYLAGGFGWPRTIEIDSSKFKHPRLYTFLTRLAGPVANLLLASIAGSIAAMMKIVDYNPRVFLMLVGVNITTAVFNLIPIPPLAGGALITALIPTTAEEIKRWFNLLGPYIIVAVVMFERIKGELPFRGYLDPLVMAVFNYIKG